MKSSRFDLNQDGGSATTSTVDLIYGVKQPSKLRLVLIVILVLCLVLAIVFIALYAKEKSDNDDAEGSKGGSTGGGGMTTPGGGMTTPRPTMQPNSTETCLDPSCITSSANLLRAMDTTVSPCDDFYQYSCGGFVKNNYIRDDQSDLKQFVIAQDTVDYTLKELIEKQQPSNYSKSSALYKALAFYQSCMNESQIEAAGTKGILDTIADYGSWTITNPAWSNATWSLETILARCLADLGVTAFLAVDISADAFNNSEVLVMIGGGSTGLGVGLDEKKLRYASQQIALVDGYKKLMKTVFQLLGADTSLNSSIDSVVHNILALEVQFHQLKHSLGEEGAIHGYRNVLKYTTINELNNMTSNKFNWTLYFEEILRGSDVSIDPDQRILASLPTDITNIIKLITGKSKSLLANAIMWNVVRRYIESLPGAFQAADQDFLEIATGVKTRSPRWKICGAKTNSNFPYAIALMYANEHLSENARKTAADMFNEIKQQFINGLSEQSWMDDKTRDAAKIKLDAMKQDVGYPAFIKDPVKLNKRYEPYDMKTVGYFDNLLNIAKTMVQVKIQALGKPPDKSGFPQPPVGVNAFFNPQTNGIAVLMGMFQEPFYESKRLKALNYGSIGMVIGHEITHGFDVSGSQFDEVGNIRSWWTNTSYKNYIERSDCLKKQYNNTFVFGRRVNGVLTLSENIADNGGLKYAYRAYQKWRAANGNEDRLPGLEFTNEQLFFIGFAQTWCTKYREQNIDEQMKQDTHALNPVRVRVPVSNFAAFSQAFGCKMPEKTCTVW